MTAPKPTPCPQCRSLYCGPYRCRFSGAKHPAAPRTVKPFEHHDDDDRVHDWERDNPDNDRTTSGMPLKRGS